MVVRVFSGKARARTRVHYRCHKLLRSVRSNMHTGLLFHDCTGYGRGLHSVGVVLDRRIHDQYPPSFSPLSLLESIWNDADNYRARMLRPY